MANNSNSFKGYPYPIVKSPRGFFGSQTGTDQIKSDLLILLLTSPGERCLTGDTKISLANGTDVPIEDLVNKGSFWVYSYDKDSNSIIPGLATAHKTVDNAKLLEVMLDNEEKVRCTPNHLWLLRNGSYRRTDELHIGDSLMPLYKNLNTSGYERVYQPALGESKRKLNHKIISINKITDREDCYDLSVEKYHNFALSAGVFVHNCMLPEFGTPLKDLIFDPADASLVARARQMIINSITKWEPRITVDQINISLGAPDSILDKNDDLTERNAILLVAIQFRDPDILTESQELVLEVPL